MNCPTCNAWSRVVETRFPRRVRECGNLHRFTTDEVLIYTHFEKKKDQEDKRHEVANAKGTIQSVAAQYNVSVSSVATWRKKYRTTE
jgi:hypothetical protein